MPEQDQISRYRAAGYTHIVLFEKWLPLMRMWTEASFPTTADALVMHETALAVRQEHGEVREIRVITIRAVTKP